MNKNLLQKKVTAPDPVSEAFHAAAGTAKTPSNLPTMKPMMKAWKVNRTTGVKTPMQVTPSKPTPLPIPAGLMKKEVKTIKRQK